VARISRSQIVASRKQQPGPRRPGFNSPCRNHSFIFALCVSRLFGREVGTRRKVCHFFFATQRCVPRLQDLLKSGFAWHLADRVGLETIVLESRGVIGDDMGVVYGYENTQHVYHTIVSGSIDFGATTLENVEDIRVLSVLKVRSQNVHLETFT
jgi:hypothetical protein